MDQRFEGGFQGNMPEWGLDQRRSGLVAFTVISRQSEQVQVFFNMSRREESSQEKQGVSHRPGRKEFQLGEIGTRFQGVMKELYWSPFLVLTQEAKTDYEVERKGFTFEVFISRIQHSKLRRYSSRGNIVFVSREGKLGREGPKSLKVGIKLYWAVRELDQGRSGLVVFFWLNPDGLSRPRFFFSHERRSLGETGSHPGQGGRSSGWEKLGPSYRVLLWSHPGPQIQVLIYEFAQVWKTQDKEGYSLVCLFRKMSTAIHLYYSYSKVN